MKLSGNINGDDNNRGLSVLIGKVATEKSNNKDRSPFYAPGGVCVPWGEECAGGGNCLFAKASQKIEVL